MNDMPPKLDPIRLPRPIDVIKSRRRRYLRGLLCKLITGHKIVDEEFIDRHGEWDGIARCVNCGEFDPEYVWWEKIILFLV